MSEEFFTDHESWTARAALAVLVDDALEDYEISKALRAEELRAADARTALLGDEALLAKIRMIQDRAEAAGPTRRPRIVEAPEVAWLVFAVLLGVGYLALFRAAWPSLPVFLRIFTTAGLLCVLVLSAWLVIRRAPVLLAGSEPGKFGEARFGVEMLRLGDRWDFALREVVLPELRAYLTAHRKCCYGTKLAFDDQQGLYDEEDLLIVPTASAKRLRRIIERADTGAVALGGQRGVGKTTAIQSMRRGLIHGSEAPAPLVVVASAPANYDARDFVLHLHALLCKAVLDLVSEEVGEPTRSRRAAVRTGLRGLANVVISVAIGWGAGGWLWGGSLLAFPGELWQLLTRDWRTPLLLWTSQPTDRRIALIIVGLLALWLVADALTVAGRWLARAYGRGRHAELRELLAESREPLDRIRFLQTHTSGWSGKLTLPAGGDLGRTRSTQRAEQQLTHPEVVASFREFARRSAATMRDTGVTDRLVVAIDELDKIGEQEKAHQLVNDVKGIFGVPGCLFFVAVSDDAVVSFEKRGLAVRDAFDSAFSELVRLEPFTMDESRLWIAKRLPGIQEQFSCLCHCLSGGLPRDLRRTTIDMVDVTTERYQPALSVVAGILVRTELAAKSGAFTGQARGLEHSDALAELWSKLLRIPESGNAVELAALAAELNQGATQDITDEVNRLRWHSSAFVLFSATLLEVFTEALTEARLTDDLHQLAVARRHLALDPHLAWLTLVDFRKARDLALPGTD
ncbi:hypothetical protein SAMN04489732_111127 [Amycolatopsis saalfeldensis]|uniref:KAP family P-loop domain-containing protein n=1 Tax=Amycolatopsis saalfeldensis TaxID=394193 RepID=A0A1H8Y615_9PSEU|nr:hypothetical protein SAMN04489732_111127 [Amycolatopsis saalfeldensis]